MIAMAKVSVIVPVYNTEKYLEECLDSITSQTLSDIEILCIDDASTDSSGEILNRYAEADNRIRVIHLAETRKQGYARNLAMKSAVGEYTYFLDSDDLIPEDALSTLYDIASKDDLDVLVFDHRPIYESDELQARFGPTYKPRKGLYSEGVCSGSELFDDLMRQNEWACIPQIFFWKTATLKDNAIDYPVGVYHEDEYFAFAGLLSAARARCISGQLTIRRYRDGSVTADRLSERNFYGYMMNYWYMNRFAAERNIHTYASQLDIAIMYGICRMLYEKMDHSKLREYCAGRGDLVLYECLTSALRSQEYWNSVSPAVLGRISISKEVMICGTGPEAEWLSDGLRIQGIEADGYIRESKAGNDRDVFRGKPVVAACEYRPKKDSLVIVAVPQKDLNRESRRLNRHGIPWIYYRKRDETLAGMLKRKLRQILRLKKKSNR